jgi:uncharacterized membrane protein YjgN (DUF898 family)
VRQPNQKKLIIGSFSACFLFLFAVILRLERTGHHAHQESLLDDRVNFHPNTCSREKLNGRVNAVAIVVVVDDDLVVDLVVVFGFTGSLLFTL